MLPSVRLSVGEQRMPANPPAFFSVPGTGIFYRVKVPNTAAKGKCKRIARWL